MKSRGGSIVQNFLNFIQFFGKIWQNRMLVPPVLPPMGNPGSAPEKNSLTLEKIVHASLTSAIVHNLVFTVYD